MSTGLNVLCCTVEEPQFLLVQHLSLQPWHNPSLQLLCTSQSSHLQWCKASEHLSTGLLMWCKSGHSLRLKQWKHLSQGFILFPWQTKAEQAYHWNWRGILMAEASASSHSQTPANQIGTWFIAISLHQLWRQTCIFSNVISLFFLIFLLFNFSELAFQGC